MAAPAEYVLVSVPGERNKEEVFQNINARTQGVSTNYKFSIPDFKVGTLDGLVTLSDDFVKIDLYVESVARKLATTLSDLLVDHKDKLQESLVAKDVAIDQYLQNFQWDAAKYPTKNSLIELCDMINKHVGQIEQEMNQKTTAYNNIKNTLAAIERKATGNLLVKSLHELVKPEHFVLGSEYLTTLLVVVPKYMDKDWIATYERLVPDRVVPRSSQVIAEDNEYQLVNVTIFTRVIEEFKIKAREKRYIVRDFVYDEGAIDAQKKEKTKLEAESKKKWTSLVRWCKTNFSEAFEAWVHVKALRVFVESVLRYGIPGNGAPVNIQPVLLGLTKKSNEKKLRSVLQTMFSHLDGASVLGGKGGELDKLPAGIGLNESEFFPYVSYNVDLKPFTGAGAK
eukprot:Colp12_sorted_trinity150504_noHs@15652